MAGLHAKEKDKKAPYLLAVLLTLVVRRYEIKHITPWRGSRAITEATGRHLWVSSMTAYSGI